MRLATEDETFCIIVDDGTNCGNKHLCCLAEKDAYEIARGLLTVVLDDGTLTFASREEVK
jgi:hypothetical protein